MQAQNALDPPVRVRQAVSNGRFALSQHRPKPLSGNGIGLIYGVLVQHAG